MTSPDDAVSDHAGLAEQVHRELFRLTANLRRQEYDQFSTGELTLTQCSVLYHLTEIRRARVIDLAAREHVTTATMAKAVRRLQELGMVRRQRDLSDYRSSWIEITTKGVQTQQAAVAGLREAMVNELSAEEISALQTALGPLQRLSSGSGHQDLHRVEDAAT
ncbi:MarR family winged helix-turn-helix transcriptional regulator [Mycolicibacterium septicum]|jgi:DNA-binding MarR family transcriptional regulator|uniref:MarR-family regulatory protein n=3 Tax=Mycolicibacterium TaxID=1866885 RepID=A0A378V2Y5_MYCFO|nr:MULTISPECIES: MarR family transcriptional regulator [Mycolicibacterium]KMV18349.1 hypothetical protein ACT17_12050 [Mycolicibacterium conceptionense]MCA4727444.1 MarR family transcriptional regulator [Mycolicibacterium fortuitum]SUA04764.1 MarR-family regulatory protein [Mycolicibacterium fortuitum]